MAKENRSQEINDKSWGGSVLEGRTFPVPEGAGRVRRKIKEVLAT